MPDILYLMRFEPAKDYKPVQIDSTDAGYRKATQMLGALSEKDRKPGWTIRTNSVGFDIINHDGSEIRFYYQEGKPS